MRSRLFKAFLAALSLPVFGYGAASSCPFLNPATAAGVLGGTVVAAVTRPAKNNDDAHCDFTRENRTGKQVLTIEVMTMTHPQKEFAMFLARCSSSPAALRAIGNEAVACSFGREPTIAEQVIGRVRDRAFVVEVSTTVKTAGRPELREQARDVAEQVAGNLF